MQITASGWDNIQTRSVDFPSKVFIEEDGKGIFEYSQVAPPLLAMTYDIESILEGAYGRDNFINLFYLLPEIFAPVNEIASRVADAVWQLRKSWNDEVDYSNKTFNRLFSQPNPMMSLKQLVWQACCYELLTGANVEYFNKPSTLTNDFENILSWWNLPTNRLCIEKKQGVDIYSSTKINDLVTGYSITENGRKRDFAIQNVLPFMNYDLSKGNEVDRFKSPLCGARLAIKNLLPVYEARGVIYIKRGALGFLVSKKSDESGLISLTKGEKEEAQREYSRSYGLNAGQNQVGVAAAPLEFIKTSMSIQELQPFEETLADAVAIYATLKVPRHLVPSKDASTFANAAADMKSFYGNVIIPMANRYAEAWTNYFNIDRHYVYADFSMVPELQENRKEKAEVDKTNGAVWLQRWSSGVCNLNEWITSFEGDPGKGNIYEKKIFDLTPEELATVKEYINLKVLTLDKNVTEEDGTTPKNTGA